jgi:hypothetical protein
MKTRILLESFDALTFPVTTGVARMAGNKAKLTHDRNVDLLRERSFPEQEVGFNPGERRILLSLLSNQPILDSPLNDL